MMIGKVNNNFADYFRVTVDAHGEHKLTMLRPDQPVSTIRLQEKMVLLVEHLRNLHLSESYIQSNLWFANLVIKLSPDDKIDKLGTYQNLFNKYSGSNNKAELVLLRRWALFDLYDILPERNHKRARSAHYSAEQLNGYFSSKIESYKELAGKTKRESTVQTEAKSLAKFFLFLQDTLAINAIDGNVIEEAILLDYKHYSGISNGTLHRVAKALTLTGFSVSVPEAKGLQKKVYPALTDDEKKLIASALLAGGDMDYLTRAVCLLLWTTGMRAGDVRDLLFDDINWDEARISYIQGKTGKAISIPLLPTVGNAIIDYVCNQRPRCELPNVFVIQNRMLGGSYTLISPARIVNALYDSLSIRATGRRGTHLYRHAFATSRMHDGTDMSVISTILGHSKPETTLEYISADLQSLRRCALPVHMSKAKVYDEED